MIIRYARVPARILAISCLPLVAFQIIYLAVSLVSPTKDLVIDRFEDGLVGFIGGGTMIKERGQRLKPVFLS